MRRRHAFALGVIVGGVPALVLSPAARTTAQLRTLEEERAHLHVMSTLALTRMTVAEQHRDRAYDLCMGTGWREHGEAIHRLTDGAP
jgi:hypothetical protein